MIVAEHWGVRKRLYQFRNEPNFIKPNGKPDLSGAEARYYVLSYLMSSANNRLRCWPSTDIIMKDTGFSKSPVTDALAFLERHGAIYNVPPELRVGREKKLHHRKKVWQLTGVMQMGSEVFQYLFIQEDDLESVFDELKSYGSAATNVIEIINNFSSVNRKKNQEDKGNGSLNELNNSSLNERSLNEPEGIPYSYEGIPSQEDSFSAPDGVVGDAALADESEIIRPSFVEYDDPADIPPLYEKKILITTPKQAQQHALNQAVADAWQTEPGSFSAKIGKLLTGKFAPSGNKAKDKRDALWIESNIDPGLSVDEIREFGQWIADELPGPPMSPDKIQMYVGRWRNHETSAEPVPESHVPFDPDKMPRRGKYYDQVHARMDQLLEEML